MATLTMGYKPGTLSRGNGEATTGWSRVTYLGKTTQPLWVRRGGVRMGRNQAGTSWAAPVLYSGPNSGDVDNLVARTNTLALSVFMDGGSRSGGGNYEAAVQTPVLIPAGTHLFGGFWVSSGNIGYGQDLSGAMMFKTVPPQGHGGSPNDPWLQSSQAHEGNIDTWWVFDTNATPGPPTAVSPPAGGMTSDQSPDINIQFVDSNPGDAPSKWLIELWNEQNTTLYYTSGVVNAPTGLYGTNKISWNPGMITARKYRVRAYTWDQGGAKSPAGQWYITINAGGTFTDITLNAPVGFKANGDAVYNDTTPDGFDAKWTHETSENLVGRGSFLWNADTGLEVRTSTWDNVNVPVGTIVSPVWPGTWAALPAGTTRYRWSIMGEDALGGFTGHNYSPVFVINQTPAFSGQAPTSGATRSNTDPGVLQYAITDPGDVDGAHAGSFDISDDAGSTWTRFAGTHIGGGVYQLALSSTHVPVNDAYSWREYAVDPWGLDNTGSWKVLNIVDPPAVTITEPVDTITTGTPTITATADRTLAEYRIVVRALSGELVLDTETVAASGSGISEPVLAGLLRNNTDYTLTITGTAADGLTFVVTGSFRLEYVPSPYLEDVELEMIESSIFDHGDLGQKPNALMQWSTVPVETVSDTDFIGYVVHRYDGNGRGRSWMIPNRSVTAMVDRSAGHGIHSWYIGYRYHVNAGVDIVESELVKVSERVEIKHAVITHEDSDVAVTMKFWTERNVSQVTDSEVRVPIGRSKPYGFQSVTDYETVRMVSRPLSSEDGDYSAQMIVEAAKDLAVPIIGDDGRPQPQPLWWRDPKGRVFRFMFTSGIITRDHHMANRSEIEINGSEITGDEIIDMAEPVEAIDLTGIVDLEMIPARVDEVVYRGDPWVRQYQLRESDGSVPDTTGYTARMWIVESPGDAVPVLSSDDDEIILTTGMGGSGVNWYNLQAEIVDTSALPVDFVGWYDIELTDLSSDERTYVFGIMRAYGDATP